ncbi:iron complex outermembrane recepter protein [bacterium A37T11]|nr:iron complex outermembrane recepter protein [bacterium A37T11]
MKGSFPYAINADSAYKNGYTVNQNGQNIEKRKLYTASLAASYRIPFATLQSITGFTNLDDTYEDYDNDLSPYEVYGYDLPLNNQKTVTQEFRIVTADERPLQLTGGIFGFTDLKKADNRSFTGSDAAAFGIDEMAPYTNVTNSTKKVYGLSGYANLTYMFAERWKLTGGVRYDYESRRLNISNTFVKEPNASEASPEQQLKGHNHSLSPRLSLSYAAAKDVLVYASYARGFRAGGFNQFTTTDYLTYDPEYSDNVELGAKTEWLDHLLRANVNLFYTNWKDQQQALIVPDFYIANIGRLVNQGAELELSLLPVKGLEVNYNLGLFHSEYKKLVLTDYNTGENMDARGNGQVFAPALTSSLSFTYRYHLPGNKAHLFIVPEWKYLSKQYLNFYNDLEQSPFSLFNLSGGLGYKAIELGVWVKNLADKQYIPYAYMPSPAASALVLLSAPRTYGLTLRTRF